MTYLKVLSPVLAHSKCLTNDSCCHHQRQSCPKMGLQGQGDMFLVRRGVQAQAEQQLGRDVVKM